MTVHMDLALPSCDVAYGPSLLLPELLAIALLSLLIALSLIWNVRPFGPRSDLCTAEWGGAELADVERLSRFAKYCEMAFSYLSDVLGVKTAAVYKWVDRTMPHRGLQSRSGC